MKELTYQHFEDTTEELEYTINVSLDGAIVYFEVIVKDDFSITFLLKDFKRILQMMEKVIDSELGNIIGLDDEIPYGFTTDIQDDSFLFYAYNLNNRIEEITGAFAFAFGNYCAKQAKQYENDEEGGDC